VHEADSEQARSGAGGLFVRVVSGAAHGEQRQAGTPAGHGYNLAAVYLADGGQLVLRVWPRRWSDKRKAFVEDQDNVPTEQPFSEHLLRLVLPFRDVEKLLQSQRADERQRGLMKVMLEKDRRHLERVLEILRNDSVAEVRAYAAQALDHLRDVRAKEGLLAAIADPSWDVRSHAGWGLVHLGESMREDVLRITRTSKSLDAVEMARLVLERL
jgi:hypothetical protein